MSAPKDPDGAAARQTDLLTLCKYTEKAAQELVGHRLFTVMRFDPVGMEVQRLYSSDPASYPPGGKKQKRDTAWGRHVLEQGKPYIGASADDIRWAFDDHELILGLGLQSVLNIPLKRGGQVVGTVNLLHEPAYFRPEHIDLLGPISESLALKL